MNPPEFVIRTFQPADTDAIVQLWTDCGLTRPWNDPYKDITRKLAVHPELFLVGTLAQTLVATAMGGYDGHRGWVNYLAVAPMHQRRGYAAVLMHHLEQRLRTMGCPKVNLLVRRDNTAVTAFYEKLNFQADDVISLGKRLIPDTAPHAVIETRRLTPDTAPTPSSKRDD